MAASVLEGHMLKGRMQSLVAQTDVEMAKEDRGRMMSTWFQVRKKLWCNFWCFLESRFSLFSFLHKFLGKCRKRTTQGNCCAFPFRYRGRRYNRCARNRRGQRWCALTPDYSKDKLWGYCRGGRKRKLSLFFLCLSRSLTQFPKFQILSYRYYWSLWSVSKIVDSTWLE